MVKTRKHDQGLNHGERHSVSVVSTYGNGWPTTAFQEGSQRVESVAEVKVNEKDSRNFKTFNLV